MDTRAPLNTLFPFPVPTQTHQSHHFPTDPSLIFFCWNNVYMLTRKEKFEELSREHKWEIYT